MDSRIKSTMEALAKNNIDSFYAKDRAEVFDIIKSLINKGDTVGVGGSVTLDKCGVLRLLRNGDYNFLDRYAAKNREEVEETMRQSFFADVYLCSANAVTTSGFIYNVDGNSNRVAAILYGPKSVIMVVGKNKIVNNISEAVTRVKTIAAPKNAQRLGCETYCAGTGVCMCKGEEFEMADGCKTDGRICCNYVVCGQQRVKGRIKVIFVDEEIGY